MKNIKLNKKSIYIVISIIILLIIAYIIYKSTKSNSVESIDKGGLTIKQKIFVENKSLEDHKLKGKLLAKKYKKAIDTGKYKGKGYGMYYFSDRCIEIQDYISEMFWNSYNIDGSINTSFDSKIFKYTVFDSNKSSETKDSMLILVSTVDNEWKSPEGVTNTNDNTLFKEETVTLYKGTSLEKTIKIVYNKPKRVYLTPFQLATYLNITEVRIKEIEELINKQKA